MRPVTLSDLNAAARVLLARPAGQRGPAMAGLIARATLADRHRQRTGRLHPAYGNGTLMAAALAHPGRAPETPDEKAYLACLACAVDAVLAYRGDTDC